MSDNRMNDPDQDMELEDGDVDLEALVAEASAHAHTQHGDSGEASQGDAGPREWSGSGTEADESEVELLREALKEQQELAGEYLDHLKRTRAEFENFRKRLRKDAERQRRTIKNEAYVSVLPVADNLERAVAAAKEHLDDFSDVGQALIQGVEFVLQNFFDVLRREGIERMDVVGKPFDPSQQEAVSVLPSPDFPDDTVMAEVMAGYVTPDEVLRPAKVVVAKSSTPGA